MRSGGRIIRLCGGFAGAFGGFAEEAAPVYNGIEYEIADGAVTVTGFTSGLAENAAIPAGVEQIGGAAFSGCRNLTAIPIPESITQIDFDAFGQRDKHRGHSVFPVL